MYELGFGFLLHSELLSSPCYALSLSLSLIVWRFRFKTEFGKRDERSILALWCREILQN